MWESNTKNVAASQKTVKEFTKKGAREKRKPRIRQERTYAPTHHVSNARIRKVSRLPSPSNKREIKGFCREAPPYILLHDYGRKRRECARLPIREKSFSQLNRTPLDPPAEKSDGVSGRLSTGIDIRDVDRLTNNVERKPTKREKDHSGLGVREVSTATLYRQGEHKVGGGGSRTK